MPRLLSSLDKTDRDIYAVLAAEPLEDIHRLALADSAEERMEDSRALLCQKETRLALFELLRGMVGRRRSPASCERRRHRVCSSACGGRSRRGCGASLRPRQRRSAPGTNLPQAASGSVSARLFVKLRTGAAEA